MGYEAKDEDRIEQIDRRTARLEAAVFGVTRDGKGGILNRLDRVDDSMRKLLWAVVSASLTFAVGSAAVVITTLSQGG